MLVGQGSQVGTGQGGSHHELQYVTREHVLQHGKLGSIWQGVRGGVKQEVRGGNSYHREQEEALYIQLVIVPTIALSSLYMDALQATDLSLGQCSHPHLHDGASGDVSLEEEDGLQTDNGGWRGMSGGVAGNGLKTDTSNYIVTRMCGGALSVKSRE